LSIRNPQSTIRNLLKQCPLACDNKKQQIECIKHINNGEQNIKFHPFSFKPPSDHDACIGHNCSCKENHEINIENTVVRLVICSNNFVPKQEHIGKQQEHRQEKQVTGF
jgi:hypothetical protein